ncbi:S26 family signal peptidase [Sphingomonas immobilis]|uniref:S26 family signal peptidase n=1 Tax=Sphingomonas immobilis TaxID=3063997 RepID=A0ABT8ZVY1_9SPHN|nr:S26 family signal peptidase [Sphingomonas sp. CA1-15]MDO7841740.1 S26 family signal peptidase [Sphingomonas sp. CA1-15]
MLSLWRLARAAARRVRRLPREAADALGGRHLGEGARSDRLYLAILIVTPITVICWWLLGQVTIVMSPSIEAMVVRPDPGPIAKGDYVMFTLSHALAGAEPVSVTKHALCMPGERLNMIEKPSSVSRSEWDGWYFCNGVLLNVSKPFARDGMHLPHLLWAGPIPSGLVFVGSPSPNGFDSRYFGLVPLAALTRARRLL